METPEILDPNIEDNKPDLTIPSVHFNKPERDEMLKKGMSEEEIDAKEIEASAKIAKNHLLNKEGFKKAA